jgi:hypothetical protein
MTDYQPLIVRAVEGLGNNTADARRALYERARIALVAQLRGIDPPLSEDEITRERLSLEDAIRKAEAAASATTPAAEAWHDRQDAPPGDRESRASINKIASSDSPRGAEPPASARKFSDEHEATWDHAEQADYEQTPELLKDGSAPMHDEQRIEPGRPPVRRQLQPADYYREPRSPRSYRGLAQLVTALVILLGVSTVVYWQWSNIDGLYQFLSHIRSRQSQTAQQPAGEPEFAKRVPQEQTRPQPPTATPNAQNAPATAQRVVLYEEDPGNPQGKQYAGSATWRTETVSPGSGLAPELQIRADVTIPERNMTVTWSLRRNTDQALPASHTIEIMFKVPPDFPGGGVANVPGVRMKESEQARGMPLAGVAVKVTNGFFLIGLSAVDADIQQNMQLLKERPWFGILIVYNNGRDAILKFEKGPSGNRAFADAFAAWGN